MLNPLRGEPWRKEKKGPGEGLIQKGDTCFPGAVSREEMEILSTVLLNFAFNFSYLLQALARLNC